MKKSQQMLITYLVTSGNHWAVRLGHSSACVITRSYRNGVFFFHILYSSFITLSSTASSKAAVTHGGGEHEVICQNVYNKVYLSTTAVPFYPVVLRLLEITIY